MSDFRFVRAVTEDGEILVSWQRFSVSYKSPEKSFMKEFMDRWREVHPGYPGSHMMIKGIPFIPARDGSDPIVATAHIISGEKEPGK